MGTEKIEVKPFLICLGFLFLIETFTATLDHMGYSLSILQIGIVRIIELILFITTVIIWGNGMGDIGLAKSQIRPGILRGIIWSLCFGGIVLIGFSALYLGGINPIKLFQGKLPEKPAALVIYFIVGGIIAPVVEEVFFRGILYGFFRQWGMIPALILSTGLFVISHPGISPVQIAGGIIFAVSYEKEGKLMTPIIIHALGNITLFSLSLLPRLGIIQIS